MYVEMSFCFFLALQFIHLTKIPGACQNHPLFGRESDTRFGRYFSDRRTLLYFLMCTYSLSLNEVIVT